MIEKKFREPSFYKVLEVRLPIEDSFVCELNELTTSVEKLLIKHNSHKRLLQVNQVMLQSACYGASVV